MPVELIHGIRAWDAKSGEDTLCGISHLHRSHVERTNVHEYVDCPDCRKSPDFDADATAPAWPLPLTTADSTRDLKRRREIRAQ